MLSKKCSKNMNNLVQKGGTPWAKALHSHLNAEVFATSRRCADMSSFCCMQIPKQSDTVALATTTGFVPRRLERENIQDFLAKKREIFLVQVGSGYHISLQLNAVILLPSVLHNDCCRALCLMLVLY
jgi:hypothetical protein